MFEWNTSRATGNYAKHGVRFEEAATVFGDPDALDGPDLSHSEKESRFLRLGRAVTGRVLIVAYTVRRRDDDESIRIIKRAPCEPQRACDLRGGVAGLTSPRFRRFLRRSSERCVG